MKAEDLKAGMLVRHKGGKLYRIDGIGIHGGVCWPCGNDPADYNARIPGDKVSATQWQVNDKHPEGRFYQASRHLKLVDLSPVVADGK